MSQSDNKPEEGKIAEGKPVTDSSSSSMKTEEENNDTNRVWLMVQKLIIFIIISAIITAIATLILFPQSIAQFIQDQPITTLIIVFVVTLVTMISINQFFYGFIQGLLDFYHDLTTRETRHPEITDKANETFPDPGAKPIEIYEWLVSDTTKSIGWYRRSRQPKRRLSRILRFFAIFFGSLGALMPLLATAADNNDLTPWGYILITIAGAFIAFDRLFGMSSGWIRYISTEFALQQLLTEFRLKWILETEKEDHEKLTMLNNYRDQIQKIIESETNQWATEFQNNIAQLELMMKTSQESQEAQLEKIKKEKEAEQQPRDMGAIHIIISNGLKFDTVDVQMDEGRKTTLRNKAEELKRIPVGTYFMKAIGKKDDYTTEEILEASVVVEKDKQAKVEFTKLDLPDETT